MVLIIDYLVFFYARKYFKLFIAITLLIGYTNTINFSSSISTVSLRIGSLKIILHPVILFISIISYITNYKKVNNVFGRFFTSNSENEEDYAKRKYEEKYNHFLKEYSTKSTAELTKISLDERYLKQAKEAAEKILEVRNTEKD
jgi:hypothetical protein